MKKNMICCLLAICVIVSLTVSCGDNSSRDDTTTTVLSTKAVTEVTTDENIIKDSVPELDFGGKELRIIQQAQSLYYIVEDEEIGEVIHDEIVRRNSELEERFKMKFTLLDRGAEFHEVTSAVRRVVDAGEDAYDLILNQIFDTGSMAASGYFRSWTEIPYLDLEQPWYTKSIREAASVGDQLLMLESDLVLNYAAQTWVLLYNKTDALALNMPDLYDVVDAGQWTYDMLYNLCSEAYSDINGDGIQNEGDYFGFASTLGDCLIASCFYAGDGRMVKLSNDLELSYPISTEHSVNVLGEISRLFYDNPSAIQKNDAGGDTRTSLFPHGNILFQFMQAGDLLWVELRDMEDEFGVLPMPKYDEAQKEHYTLVDGGGDIMTIPKTVSDLEIIGAAVEAASADSYNNLMPAFMGLAMEQKGTRDQESIAMLRRVFDSRVVDFAYLYDGGSSFTFKLKPIIKNPDKIVSTVEKNLKSVNSYYSKLIDKLQNNEE